MCTVESLRCALCHSLWRVLDVHCALCRDVQLAEETSYGVQTVLAHATTLEDDDNDDDDDDDGPHLTTLNIRVQN